MVPEWVTGDLLVVLAFCFRKLLAHVFVTRNAVAVSCALLCYRSCPCVSPERELNLDRTRSLLEVGPFNLLPGYAAGMPGRTLPVERVGSDLNTRGYSDPAGNDAMGTRVARFEDPRFNIIPHISRKLIQISTKHENPFVWWLARRDSFPLTEVLAGRVLCVQASSASSERLLSIQAAGLALTKKRLALKSNRVAQMITARGAITSGLLDHY